jgi:hypothetical protein
MNLACNKNSWVMINKEMVQWMMPLFKISTITYQSPGVVNFDLVKQAA